jgi:hypothetical protein
MTAQPFQNHPVPAANTAASSIVAFPLPAILPPLTSDQKRSLIAEQAAFDRQFPPLRHRDDDILIISWSEIQRQFLDLCAPWDQADPAIMIRVAQQTSAFESAEKTIRTLFVMNHMRTSIDSQRPRRFASGNPVP